MGAMLIIWTGKLCAPRRADATDLVECSCHGSPSGPHVGLRFRCDTARRFTTAPSSWCSYRKVLLLRLHLFRILCDPRTVKPSGPLSRVQEYHEGYAITRVWFLDKGSCGSMRAPQFTGVGERQRGDQRHVSCGGSRRWWRWLSRGHRQRCGSFLPSAGIAAWDQILIDLGGGASRIRVEHTTSTEIGGSLN